MIGETFVALIIYGEAEARLHTSAQGLTYDG